MTEWFVEHSATQPPAPTQPNPLQRTRACNSQSLPNPCHTTKHSLPHPNAQAQQDNNSTRCDSMRYVRQQHAQCPAVPQRSVSQSRSRVKAARSPQRRIKRIRPVRCTDDHHPSACSISDSSADTVRASPLTPSASAPAHPPRPETQWPAVRHTRLQTTHAVCSLSRRSICSLRRIRSQQRRRRPAAEPACVQEVSCLFLVDHTQHTARRT